MSHTIDDLDELLISIPTFKNCGNGCKRVVLKDAEGNEMFPQPSNKIFGKIDILDLYNKMFLRIMELEERVDKLEGIN